MKRLLLKKTVLLALTLLLLVTMAPLSGQATQSSGNGEPAPLAPEDLLSEVDKSFLQNRVDKIHAENLNEVNYTEDSWQALEEALDAAENVLNNPEVKQSNVDAALASLNETYAGLEFISAQYETDFAKSEAGEPPVDWTPLWRESSWTVLDEPSRLEHVVTPGGKRRALTWDVVGEVHGDTEVSCLTSPQAGSMNGRFSV